MQSVSFCLRQEVLRQHLTRRRGGSEWRRLDQLQVKIKTFWVGYTWEANSYLNKGGSFPSHGWSQQIFFPDIYTCYIYIYIFFSVFIFSLFVNQDQYVSSYQEIRPSIHLPISLSSLPHIPIHLPTHSSIYLFILPSIHHSSIHQTYIKYQSCALGGAGCWVLEIMYIWRDISGAVEKKSPVLKKPRVWWVNALMNW